MSHTRGPRGWAQNKNIALYCQWAIVPWRSADIVYQNWIKSRCPWSEQNLPNNERFTLLSSSELGTVSFESIRPRRQCDVQTLQGGQISAIQLIPLTRRISLLEQTSTVLVCPRRLQAQRQQHGWPWNIHEQGSQRPVRVMQLGGRVGNQQTKNPT